METLKLSKLQSSIIYLTDKLPGSLTRTKLVKLLYLADRIAVRERGFPVTDINYRRYYYGPYSDEIVKALNYMRGFEILEVMGVSMAGRSFYTYYPGDTPRYRSLNLSPADQTILDRVIEDFGHMPLPELLDVVYDTPEFKATDFGKDIRLATDDRR